MSINPLQLPNWGPDPLGIANAAQSFTQNFFAGKQQKFEQTQAKKKTLLESLQAIAQDPATSQDARAKVLSTMVDVAADGKVNEHTVMAKQAIAKMLEEGKKYVSKDTGESAPQYRWGDQKIVTPGDTETPAPVTNPNAMPQGSVTPTDLENFKQNRAAKIALAQATAIQSQQHQFQSEEQGNALAVSQANDPQSYFQNADGTWYQRLYDIPTGTFKKIPTDKPGFIVQQELQDKKQQDKVEHGAAGLYTLKTGKTDFNTLSEPDKENWRNQYYALNPQSVIARTDLNNAQTINAQNTATAGTPPSQEQTIDDKRQKDKDRKDLVDQFAAKRKVFYDAGAEVGNLRDEILSAQTRMQAIKNGASNQTEAALNQQYPEYKKLSENMESLRAKFNDAKTRTNNALRDLNEHVDNARKANNGDGYADYETIQDPTFDSVDTSIPGMGALLGDRNKAPNIKVPKALVLDEKTPDQGNEDSGNVENDLPGVKVVPLDQARKQKLKGFLMSKISAESATANISFNQAVKNIAARNHVPLDQVILVNDVKQ